MKINSDIPNKKKEERQARLPDKQQLVNSIEDQYNNLETKIQKLFRL
jgi:uncharacterized protein YlxW (UPF0749 family)